MSPVLPGEHSRLWARMRNLFKRKPAVIIGVPRRRQILNEIEALKAAKVRIQQEIAQKVQEYREEFD